MESQIKYTTYGLFDPRTIQLKYVGVTTQRLEKRLNTHLKESRKKKESSRFLSPKNKWILSLSAINQTPIIIALEDHNNPIDSQNSEKRIISYFKKKGYTLCNGTSGGEQIFDKDKLAHLTPRILKRQGHFNARKAALDFATEKGWIKGYKTNSQGQKRPIMECDVCGQQSTTIFDRYITEKLEQPLCKQHYRELKDGNKKSPNSEN
jgi:hypothetical protein